MSVKRKQLKENNEVFHPITVAKAVIFEDRTTAEISEQEMEEIFDWVRPNTVSNNEPEE